MLIGIAFLMRSFIIYYLIIILIYLIIRYKFLSIKPIIYTVLGTSLIIIPFMINNFYRSKVMYVTPMQAKMHIAKYHEFHILARGLGVSTIESQKLLSDRNDVWVKKNIKYNSEFNRIKYYNYRQSEAYNTIVKYKFTYFTMLVRGTLKNSLLNPLLMWVQNTKYHNSKEYFQTSDQKKVLLTSIIYSAIIYSLSFIGLISFIKKDKSILFLLIGSIIYFAFMAGIGGSQRYFSPAIIFLSLFFCFGLENLLTFLKKNKLN
jgi:hypothetical protein